MGVDHNDDGGKVNEGAQFDEEADADAENVEKVQKKESKLPPQTEHVTESKSDMLDPETRPPSSEDPAPSPPPHTPPIPAQQDDQSQPAVVHVQLEQSDELQRSSHKSQDTRGNEKEERSNKSQEKSDGSLQVYPLNGNNGVSKGLESEISAYADAGNGPPMALQEDEAPPMKKGWKYFWRRTMADITNKQLIAIKILFFFKAATLFVLYPFLTLHIKSLGLNSAEAGINSALSPIVAILGHPVAGIIADKIGNFKILLSGLTFTTAGFALLLLLVPPARETFKLPSEITFSLECGGEDNRFTLEMVENSLCTLNFTRGSWVRLPSASVQCGSVCPAAVMDTTRSSPYPDHTLPIPSNSSYLLPMKNYVFTPSPDHRPGLICDRKDTNVSCYLGFSETTGTASPTTASISFHELRLLGNGTVGSNLTHLSLAMDGQWNFDNQVFKSVPHCLTGHNLTGASPLTNFSNGCIERCFVEYERSLFCSNDEEVKVHDVSLTFWLYTLFRTILGLGSATTWIMFEGAVLAILKECGGDYGLQRVSAVIAAIVVSPLSGALIFTYQDFRPAFYLYAILQCLSALLTLKIDLTFKIPGDHVLGHLKEVLSQLEILIFFCAMFLSGSAWGYLESFLFWFLKDMGGNEILMGLTISVGGLAGIPLLIVSRLIIKKMGHVNVLCLGLLFYSLRLFGYSYITNPWMCLPFEAMEAITVSLAITAAATYAAALSTEQTIASVQGFMGALYFGIGRGAGSLIGGFLIRWYGSRPTFQIFGVAAFVSCVVYFILNMVYIRKHSRVKEGLDLHNLRGDTFDNVSYRNSKNTKQATIQDNRNPGSGSINTDDTKLGGGYVGPIDINSFTDIPLDEEDGGGKQQSTNFSKRPASYPHMRSKNNNSNNSRASETRVLDS